MTHPCPTSVQFQSGYFSILLIKKDLNPMKLSSVCAVFFLSATVPALAAKPTEPFSGMDLSGVYACTGQDAHDGEFKATVTLKRNAQHSTGKFSGYAYQMQVEGFGLYLGSAAAQGKHLAITFANENPDKKDYGTGIATIVRAKSGLTLEKFYFQPEYEGGNHGFETCVRRDGGSR